MSGTTEKEIAIRRLSWLLFLTAVITFAYFQPGGGWNQNARFAMVRAVVEQGEFTIDSYLIYVRAKNDPSSELRRISVANAEYETGGERRVLMWPSKSGQFFPVNKTLEGSVAALDRIAKTIVVQDSHKVGITVRVAGTTNIQRGTVPVFVEALTEGSPVQVSCALDQAGRIEAKAITLLSSEPSPVFKDLGSVAATGDLSFYRGHFYPNKAPGTSFAALPAYWLIFHIEKLIGANPDEWWTLTLNAWLTSLFSVGIISGLAVLVFFRQACEFSRGDCRTSLIGAWIFAAGTMFFPNGTLFFEHNVAAAALLGSFYLLYCTKTAWLRNGRRNGPANRARAYIFLAGFSAGWAAITNYIFVVVVFFLAAYLVFSVNRKVPLLWFSLGLLGPFLLICAYNFACFDTPFTTNYHYQNPNFEGVATRFLNVFGFPRWDVLLIILFSPFRGLFFTAPVLIVSIFGLFAWIRDRTLRPETILILGIFLFCLLSNITFNGWDGGDTALPRYLGPAIPFLTLATLYGIARFFKTTCVLAAVSITIMLLVTAVDPQPPIGSGEGVVLDRPQWQYDPFAEYDLPVFITRKPLPLLRQQERQVIYYYDIQLSSNGWTELARKQELGRIRMEIDRKIAAGEPAPLLLDRIGKAPAYQYLVGDSSLSIPVGPVSAHSYGFYGGWIDGSFGASGSKQARWNSFNVGEFLLPESRLSLLPLLFLVGFAGWRMFLVARQLDIGYDSSPSRMNSVSVD